MKIIIFLIMACLWAAPVLAGNALFCTFPKASYSHTIENPEIKTMNQDFSFTLSHFDEEKGKAKMSGNLSTEIVNFSVTKKGYVFLDITRGGNAVITTVFHDKDSKGDFLAVHSRHLNLLGQFSISQNFGSCKLINIPN